MEKQVVSKERVFKHGEVYTGKREVSAMLDLVNQETENIDSRFLEPACGRGIFLAEVLKRKLQIVESRYRKSQLEFERNAVRAISSIYGIDILEDNVEECRKHLYGIFDWKYSNLYKKTAKNKCRAAVRFILERNIIWGDALDLMACSRTSQPIVFSEWSFPFNNSKIKRRDYTFADLMPDNHKKGNDLFSEPEQLSDLGDRVFIPKEIHSFPPIHFLKIGEE